MTKWSHLDDIWSDDHPAVARGREAIHIPPTEESAPAPAALDPKAEVAALRDRLRTNAGDRNAYERLRDLLARLGRG